MKALRHLSNVFLSVLANTVLTFIAIVVILCGIGLSALYLIKYVDTDTEEIRTLQCLIGFVHEGCPEYKAEMSALQEQLQGLQAQKTETEARLAELKGATRKLENLRRIEDAIDSVTLFQKHYAPVSGFQVTVGTVYSHLVEPDLSPEWFCYISLPAGAFQEDRNLHFRHKSGFQNFDAKTLRSAGISAETMRFAKSVCKPYLIGGVE